MELNLYQPYPNLEEAKGIESGVFPIWAESVSFASIVLATSMTRS